MTTEPKVSADDLLRWYGQGVFPMADSRHDRQIFLVDPVRRGVIPLEGLKVPRRLARTVRSDRYEVRVDTAFREVIRSCAEPRPDRRETWINGVIERLCGELFDRGRAHSVEAWRGDELVGGLYGVALGAAFFGESMFSRERDASKVALVHLVARLRFGGFRLLDAQFVTDHLTRLGAVEISRETYRSCLDEALRAEADFLAAPVQTPGAWAMQSSSQAS